MKEFFEDVGDYFVQFLCMLLAIVGIIISLAPYVAVVYIAIALWKIASK